jgi:hypothetical protein
MMEPSFPCLKILHGNRQPNGDAYEPAVQELIDAIISFDLWPCVLVTSDRPNRRLAEEGSRRLEPGDVYRGEWVRRALHAHLKAENFQNLALLGAGFQGENDFLDISALASGGSRQLHVVIEVDNSRPDELCKKYISRKVTMLRKHHEDGHAMVYCCVCYPGDSAYDPNGVAGYFEMFMDDAQQTDEFTFLGFMVESPDYEHVRVHPWKLFQREQRWVCSLHTYAKNNLRGLVRVRDAAMRLFDDGPNLTADSTEELTLREDAQHLRIEQIKGLLYFPQKDHDVIRDWDRLRAHLEKGR